MRRSDADNRAIGGTLNLNSLWSKLGTFSISYNDDRRYNSHYYTADYYQSVYSSTFGSLGLRAGIQRYNNGDSSANTGKYIALDLSLPLGNWFSAGMTHQNGYTIVREIGGHGVGLQFHEDPWVGYVGKRGTDMLLAPGMVFTIEPMVNQGSYHVKMDSSAATEVERDWIVLTSDGKFSAQWEITVAVTEDGAEVLTY